MWKENNQQDNLILESDTQEEINLQDTVESDPEIEAFLDWFIEQIDNELKNEWTNWKTDSTPKDEWNTTKTPQSYDGYVEYNEIKLLEALAEKKQVILFFHATWCSTCWVLNTNIATKETLIKENTIIFKVDFDAEENLKRRYWVTSQHTVVYLDQEWEVEKRVRGSIELDEILNDI